MKRAIILLVSLLGVLEPLSASEERPHLGIISDDKTRQVADLLTVELVNDGVDLLERDAIDRVLREQSLTVAGLTREQSMRVGRLLKADGLLFLRSDGTNKTDRAHVRLVAVDPGVIVWMAEYVNDEIQQKTTARWVRELADEVQGYLDKLQVSREQAVPISLVQLRAPLDDAQALQLDRDINRLLRLRLARETKLFVLDRDNLMQLEEEKRWSGEATGFWTGSRLLDGDIRPDLVSTNKVTVSLNLRTADGKSQAQWSETDNPQNLGPMMNRLVTRLVQELGQSSVASDWSAEAEAREFFNAARNRRFHARFKAAIESAWVLGHREPAAAGLYMEALIADAQFAGEAPYKYGAESSEWRGGRDDQFIDWLAGNSARTGEAIMRCQRAMDFFLAQRDQMPAIKSRHWEPWSRRGLKLVNNTVWILKHLKATGTLAAHREAADHLQRTARALLDVIWVPGYSFAEHVTEDVAIHSRWLWNTPEELLVFIRKILLAPLGTWATPIMGHNLYMLAREELIQPSALQPELPQLATSGGRSAADCWANLLQDLLASDQTPNRVFACRALCQLATTPAEREQRKEEFRQAMWEAREAIAKGHLHFYRSSLDYRSTEDRDLAIKLFEYVCEHLQTGYYTVQLRITSATIDPFVQNSSLTEEQARRVLKAARLTLDKIPKSKGFYWVADQVLHNYPNLKPAPKAPPLRIEKKLFIVNNQSAPEPARRPPLTDVFHWRDNRVWFFWDDVFGLDLLSGEVVFVKGPEDAAQQYRKSTGMEDYKHLPQHFVVTDAHYVVMFTGTPYDRQPTQIWVRPRQGGDWTMREIRPTICPRPFAVGETVYCQWRNGDVTGLLRFNLPGGEVEILADSLDRNKGFAQFDRLGPAKDGGILTGTFRGPWKYHFDPAASTWRKISLAESEELAVPGTRIGADCHYAWWERKTALRERMFGKPKLPCWEQVPLEFVDIPFKEPRHSVRNRFFRSYNMVLETPTAFLVPFYWERGFWVIPYDEAEAYIQALDADPAPETTSTENK